MMDEGRLASILLGGVSLLGGYFGCRFLVSYLYPEFTDFRDLEKYLKNTRDGRAKVMVEGQVGKLSPAGKAVESEKTRLGGAVGVDTKITCNKDGEGGEEWRSTTALKALSSFSLFDGGGCCIIVKSIGEASGLEKVMKVVYKAPSEEGLGVANVDEVSNSGEHLLHEHLLLHGAQLAGYGEAVLNKSELSFGARVSFTPSEVSSSIQDLNPKMKAGLKLLSVFLLVVGGGMIAFGGATLLMRFSQQQQVQRIENRID